MNKTIIQWAIGMAVAMTINIANAESTLVLELAEQYNEQLQAMQEVASKNQHKLKVTNQTRSLVSKIQKLPKDSVDQQHAVGEYVSHRLDELDNKYNAVEELKQINVSMYDTLARLIDQVDKPEKGGEALTAAKARNLERSSKIALAGTAKMMALVTRDRLFNPGISNKRINYVIRNASKHAEKLSRRSGYGAGQIKHLENILDELEAQGVLLEQAARTIGDRLTTLRYINDSNRSRGIIRHTDKVLADLGIEKLFDDTEGEDLDRIVEGAVFGDRVTESGPGNDADFGATYEMIKGSIK